MKQHALRAPVVSAYLRSPMRVALMELVLTFAPTASIEILALPPILVFQFQRAAVVRDCFDHIVGDKQVWPGEER